MMRHLLALLILLPLLAACGHPHKAALPPGSVVLALGDSLTAGNGVTPAQAWPALLQEKSGWQVINGGISGNTTADGLRRLPALLAQYEPKLVLVTLGGNDMLRHMPEQEIVTHLEKILDMIKAQGAQAVLVATPEPNVMGAAFHHLAAPGFYRRLAQSRNLPLIEDAIADVLSDPRLKGDQIHPNAEGHAQLAQKIYERLQEIGYAR